MNKRERLNEIVEAVMNYLNFSTFSAMAERKINNLEESEVIALFSIIKIGVNEK